jgi:hypothetical protein
MQNHLTSHLPTPMLPLRAARVLVASALLLAPATVLAQDQPAPPPPPPENPTPPENPAPAPEATPPAEPKPAEGGKSLEERLTDVEGKVDGIAETYPALTGDVAGLKRLKFSGYIQSRYERTGDASWGFTSNEATGAPRGKNRFYIRRGRLKTTYAGDISEYMLQIDAASETGVTLKDAEASLVLNETVFPGPTPWEFKLTLGQFKVPFGFEVVQSSADREMPERAQFIRAYFPGERDRGLRMTFRYDWLRVATAVINGNFTQGDTAGSLGFDQSSFKDVIGHVGGDFEFLAIAGSLQWGHDYRQAGAGRNQYLRYNRFRLGADAQFYYDIPSVGGLSLKGEVVYQNDSNLAFSGAPADKCLDLKSYGWYAILTQNVGEYFGFTFRADQFDPNTGVEDTCTNAAAMTSKTDRNTNFGGALLIYFSGNLKATLAVQHFGEQSGRGVDNDIYTAQLQARF